MRGPVLGVPGAFFALLLSGCSQSVFAEGVLDDQNSGTDPNEPDPWAQAPSTDGEDTSERGPFGCRLSSGIANGDRTRLSYAAVAALANAAGIPCGPSLVTAVALAGAESGRFQYAYARNKDCTYDRGIWQINSHFWKSYSNYQPDTNAKGMVEISGEGTDWTPWVAYTNGSYRQFLSSACVAVEEFCEISSCE